MGIRGWEGQRTLAESPLVELMPGRDFSDCKERSGKSPLPCQTRREIEDAT
jgi:hypothetical protein